MNKTKKRKSYTVGAIVMAGMILLSVPVGAKNSFADLRREAENDYYYDDAGYAIYDGIDKREEAASNLVTVAKKYVDDNLWLDPYIDELEYRIKYNQNTLSQCGVKEVEANYQMGLAAERLYEELEKIELSEKDAKYPKEFIAQMRSEQDKLERSSYNDGAKEFNAKLNRFPISILKNIVDIEPMGVFSDEYSAPVATEDTAVVETDEIN